MKDYFDNDDLNDMFNDDNENGNDFLGKHDEEFDEMMEDLERLRFERMVHENYKNLKTNGISITNMIEYGPDNIKKLKTTLEIMLNFFEEREEYEKCADIRDISEKIKDL